MAAVLAGIALCGFMSAGPALAATTAPLAVATTSLPPGTAATSYSVQLAATGGTKPYQWSITAGALPAGLTLHAATGAITGKPAATGTFSFTVEVTDSESTPATASASESITVTAPPLAVATTSLPAATAGVPYSATLAATGGVAPYTWLLSGGALPEGLTLHTNGKIVGTPKAGGTADFTVEVADSDSPAETATASLSITVGVASLVITTGGQLPTAHTGTPYSVKLAADGGTTPYAWSITSGSLPAGLTLHPNGTISGTPSAAGTGTFTVQVTDSESPPAVGTGYSAQLQASSGTQPYTWTMVSGSLPDGLTLDYYSGVISGTPAGTPGTYTFTAQVADSENPAATATQTLTLTLLPALTITTTSPLELDEAGAPYSAALTAEGGVAPYTWSIISGSLPSGLSLNATTGVISGTAIEIVGQTYTFTVQVIDSEPAPGDVVTATLQLSVVGPGAD